MTSRTILVVDDAREIREFLTDSVLRPFGYQALTANSGEAGLQVAHEQHPDLVISDIKMPGISGLDMARRLLEQQPDLPVILITAEGTEQIAQEALRIGVADYFIKPFDPSELLQSVERLLERRNTARALANAAPPGLADEAAGELGERVKDLETLTRIGHEVTAVLDLDKVLQTVVEAAVNLTGAEEGSLLLLEASTHELTMRAAKNFDENFVRTFRVRSNDSLAGQVIQTGEAVLMDDSTPQKIKTSYLVHSLIYVPLRVRGQVIGVLGVDNRHAHMPFRQHSLRLLQALGDYAAIAIENARLYSIVEAERLQLYTILNETEDGVIVVDNTDRLILMNPTARAAFHVDRVEVTGRPVREVVHNADILTMLNTQKRVSEVPLTDGRVFSAHLTSIARVGRAILLADVTHLKELDRIKADFVTTVSHDLRSPLTAILGYVELIGRVGPINTQQAEFMRQIRASVQAMNALIADLLDLGRIEAGFDAQKEVTSMGPLVQITASEFLGQAKARHLVLLSRVTPDLPPVLGNGPRLRQLLSNLVENAIKYTPEGGQVSVEAYSDGDFVVVTVSDNGIGIPAVDQPYIFDKFFRGSNARDLQRGTGLGLSIVKSIVDNHNGRIWMDSTPDKGTTFTVMLPKYQPQEEEHKA
jgi:two-component system NtrC family sensor kinase